MATALHGFRSTATICICKKTPYRYALKPIRSRRTLSTTFRRAEKASPVKSGLAKLRQTELNLEQMQKNSDDHLELYHQRIDAVSQKPYELMQVRRKKLKETFMNMGEAEPWEDEYTMEDDDDDMNTLAHGELEQHREMRHYARLVAWEMPLLSSLFYWFQGIT